eukprot:CAMPEP_0119310048 /NCGR_PEP_ID=MMETSP1333-20130426/17673_1 /TAXON_ID=418940 /ORGANISM="Scyphosphaera apsteinii, Strain RCC1455" /LENGTH=512 /DNA_ID=CAMNT_0007314165 /DNA_START=139 /DNA_END=1677 /DNA_ORIENTATION=-
MRGARLDATSVGTGSAKVTTPLLTGQDLRPRVTTAALPALLRFLYGELTGEQLVQAGWLSALLCLLVGIYWLMRSLKDSVFATIVGLEYQPLAKMLSLIVVTILLLVYNKLVDHLTRSGLFYVVCWTYACVFLLIAACLSSTRIGLNGPNNKPMAASPWRLIGWLHYFAIESYGSISVSLFWQFTNSHVSVGGAKAQYGIIVAGGQLGAISGCALVLGAKRFGIEQLCAFGGLLTFTVPLLMNTYRRHVLSHEQRPDLAVVAVSERRVAPGLFEGLRLIMIHPFVLGIFSVSSLYKVIATIMDYQLQCLAKIEHVSTAEFAAFMGLFGFVTNCVSLVFSLFGTSCVIRILGLRYTLMLYPATLGAVAGAVWLFPSPWRLFHMMVGIKGLSYALQSPSREILYVVTSDSIKLKAKSWIDIFGSHAAKAVGSVVNNTFKNPLRHLITYGSLVAFVIAVLLMLLGSWLGRSFEHLSTSGIVIGRDDEPAPQKALDEHETPSGHELEILPMSRPRE